MGSSRSRSLLLALGAGALLIYFGVIDIPASDSLTATAKNESESLSEERKPQSRSLLYIDNYLGFISEDADENQTISYIGAPDTSILENDTQIESFRPTRTVMRRKKRHARSKRDEFSWNFNVNVTRVRNVTSNGSAAITTNSSSEDNYLGVKVSVEGNGHKEEINNAWNSVGVMLKRMFGSSLDELETKGHNVSIDAHSSLDSDVLDVEEENNSQDSGRREGKFLFGILGIGGNIPSEEIGSGGDFEGSQATDEIKENLKLKGKNSHTEDDDKMEQPMDGSVMTVAAKEEWAMFCLDLMQRTHENSQNVKVTESRGNLEHKNQISNDGFLNKFLKTISGGRLGKSNKISNLNVDVETEIVDRDPKFFLGGGGFLGDTGSGQSQDEHENTVDIISDDGLLSGCEIFLKEIGDSGRSQIVHESDEITTVLEISSSTDSQATTTAEAYIEIGSEVQINSQVSESDGILNIGTTESASVLEQSTQSESNDSSRLFSSMLGFGSGSFDIIEPFETKSTEFPAQDRLFIGVISIGSGERDVKEDLSSEEEGQVNEEIIDSSGSNADNSEMIQYTPHNIDGSTDTNNSEELEDEPNDPRLFIGIIGIGSGSRELVDLEQSTESSSPSSNVQSEDPQEVIRQEPNDGEVNDLGSADLPSAIDAQKRLFLGILGFPSIGGNGDWIDLIEMSETETVNNEAGSGESETITKQINESTTKATFIPRRGARFDDSGPEWLDNNKGSEIEETGNIFSSTELDQSGKEDTTIEVKIFTTDSSKDIEDSLKVPKTRSCTSASQCNMKLNEKCISKGSHSICDCRRSFVRHPETNKCEAPVLMKVSTKFPKEVFHKDLKNKNSERFKKTSSDSIETMRFLLAENPDLLATVVNIGVEGFDEGSLLVHWNLTMVAEQNDSVTDVIKLLDMDLNEAFADKDVLERAPLNVQNAVLLRLERAVDPCSNTDSNYCSKDAHCVPDNSDGFKCHCKEGFFDDSDDKSSYPGEVCNEMCPEDFCGSNGQCNITQSKERICICEQLHYGKRCEIPAVMVAAIIAVVVALIAFVVGPILCIRKRRRSSHFYGGGRLSTPQNIRRSIRLSDTIAMSDMSSAKGTKYKTISSTPMHMAPLAPTIQVTSPSVGGSSASYDDDSTFDRTPN